RAEGRVVTTAAGLGAVDAPNAVQRGMVARAGFQCGFCTAGMVVTASGLAAARQAELPGSVDHPGPSVIDDERAELLKGNLCRCTGYRAIADALSPSCASVCTTSDDPVATPDGVPSVGEGRGESGENGRRGPAGEGAA